MSAYHNENDPYASRWLRNLAAADLIPAGYVDDRSIVEIQPGDLAGYDQCHFFAGIGGWPHALRLAGWPDERPVWTGSCPCQPLSSAGQRRGDADSRHLWPALHRLIAECAPPTIFGEQVASALGREWLAGVRADLEQLGYAFGAADLCAASVGAPHIRQRLFWVADTTGQWGGERRQLGAAQGERVRDAAGQGDRVRISGSNRADEWVAISHRAGHEAVQRGVYQEFRRDGRGVWAPSGPECRIEDGGMADTEHAIGRTDNLSEKDGRDGEDGRWAKVRSASAELRPVASAWNGENEWLPCLDGKARRTQSGLFPLADGVPEAVDGLGSISRVGTLRGAGNAIVPQVAAEFVRAFLECVS